MKSKIDLITRVEEIMTENTYFAKPDDSLHDVEQIFKSHRFHHLPVVHKNQVVGMISYGDLLVLKDWGTYLNLRRSDLNNREIFRTHFAKDIMSKNVIVVKEHYTLKQIVQMLRPNKYHAFPVIRDDKLVGIITSYDIIQKAFGE